MTSESVPFSDVATGKLVLAAQERKAASQSWLGSCLKSEVQVVALGLGFLFYLLCGG